MGILARLVLRRSCQFLFLSVLLCSCAETRIYSEGQIACIIQGDATNVTFRSGDVYFHADAINHSTATDAAYNGVGKVITGIGAGVTSGLLAHP